jgi:hypothetical protein
VRCSGMPSTAAASDHILAADFHGISSPLVLHCELRRINHGRLTRKVFGLHEYRWLRTVSNRRPRVCNSRFLTAPSPTSCE